jgi:tricorn protease
MKHHRICVDKARLSLVILGIAFFYVSTFAQTSPIWLRYPAISPDGKTIVFTYKGDLYRVPSSGGMATLMTMHEAHDFKPVWSHDGKTIAFASDRFGNFDVFVIPAAGGKARRLTFHSADEYPFAYSRDNKSVFFGATRLDTAASRTFPTSSQPELYRVPAVGGRTVQVLTTPAEHVNPSHDGRYLIYHDKKGGESEWRKHHTSAIARDIWIYDTKTGRHRKITTFSGEDRNPVFIKGDKDFYYVSEESGSFNVHRMSVKGGPSRQVTHFNTHPIRFLSVASDDTLCFGFDGEIFTQQEGSEPSKINIRIAADARINNEVVIPISGGAREFAVSPNGKEIAVIVRGSIFAARVDGGITKRITSSYGQERSITFSHDGNALLYASERGGRWGIYEIRRSRDEEPYFYASTVLKETAIVANEHQNTQPAYSPDGKEIAFIEDRMTLKILDVESKKTRILLTDRELFSMRDNDQYFQWSPDGRWILFDYSVPGLSPPEVGLMRTDGSGKAINLTLSGFSDSTAKWILGGEAAMWFSNRDGMKAVAWSGGSQNDVYALFFTQEAWDRFQLSKEEAALLKEIEEKKAKAEEPKEKKEPGEKKEAIKELVIDWDGLQLRKARLTIHSSSLGDALVNKDGDTLYYLARFERGMNLWTTNLRTKETKMLVALNAGRGSMKWDKEQKSIFLLADGKMSKIDPSSGKRESVNFRGEMTVDLIAERNAMFEHVWRRTLETFYTAGYHGADWIGLKSSYEKHLPHIGNNYEFAELLSEMLGELNVSHSGARYHRSIPNPDQTASLGALYDTVYQGSGVRIEEVIVGGPLDKAGLNVKPGTIIEAIDGVAIAADKDLSQYLNRKSGQNTLLVVDFKGAKRDITVKPISLRMERSLLYRRWVLRNQEEVDRLSGGRLGYIHVPGMNDRSYRTAYEEVMGKFAEKDGIVVDTRFNGGGDLVADLAMFLSGSKFMDYTTDTRSNGYEPNFRWTKPSISLVNEANYSDGHCYAFAYQSLKLGKLVGMPVPGTCTFSGWESLGETGIVWGVPPLGVKAIGVGYLENKQTEPDIKIMNSYEEASKGRDEQLEAAVAELLREIK